VVGYGDERRGGFFGNVPPDAGRAVRSGTGGLY